MAIITGLEFLALPQISIAKGRMVLRRVVQTRLPGIEIG